MLRDMNSEISELIGWWITKEDILNAGERPTPAFVTFFIYYMCLDAWLTAESQEDTDRKKTQWLIGTENELKNAFEHGGFNKSDLIGLKDLSPVEDMRPRHAGEYVFLHDTDNLEEVINFIYQIRCNLFHGGKSPVDERDNTLVFLAGNFLKNWLRWVYIEQHERRMP
jgi:hypothetical protein